MNAMPVLPTRDVPAAAAAVPDGSAGLPNPAYVPDGRDHRILKAYVQLLDENKDATHAQLATALNCTRQAVTKRFTKPGFREWLGGQLEDHLREERGPILTAFARYARRGSVQHFDRIAKVLGWYPGEGLEAPGGRPVQINLLVPAPQWPQVPRP